MNFSHESRHQQMRVKFSDELSKSVDPEINTSIVNLEFNLK